MAKATLEIDDHFIFRLNKKNGNTSSKKDKAGNWIEYDSTRKIPDFAKQFFEKNISTRSELYGEEWFDKYAIKYFDGETTLI
jgi:hypothetical protein